MERYLELVKHEQHILSAKNEWKFKIHSIMLTVSLTTLAVIISLKDFSSDNLYSRFLLSSSILLNILCILFSCISIFENKVMFDILARTCHNNIDKYIHGTLEIDPLSLHKGKPRKNVFVISEIMSYISFLMFIFALAIYAICKI